jgi:hypothetical protein
MDQLSKQQAAQHAANTVQQSALAAEAAKKDVEKAAGVEEAEGTGDGAETVKNRERRKGAHDERGEGEGEERDDDDEANRVEVIKDPDLGKTLDITG